MSTEQTPDTSPRIIIPASLKNWTKRKEPQSNPDTSQVEEDGKAAEGTAQTTDAADDVDAQDAAEEPEFTSVEFDSTPKRLSIPTISSSYDDEDYPLNPASLPFLPGLGKPLIAIIAVVSTLFGAALILLFCIVIMRLLGV